MAKKSEEKIKADLAPVELAEVIPAATPDKVREAEGRLQNVRQIATRDAEIFVELARELYEIKKDNLFLLMTNDKTGANFTSMTEFIEVEVSYSGRKASYLLDIHAKYGVELNCMDQVKHVGWTKLAELAPLVNSENLDKWIGLAEQESVKGLQKLIKAERDAVLPSPEQITTESTVKLGFQLFPEQLANVDEALRVAKTLSQSENKSDLLDMICLDFVTSNADAANAAIPTEQLLARLERQLGLRLVAFSGESIIYGRDVLEALSQEGEDDDDGAVY